MASGTIDLSNRGRTPEHAKRSAGRVRRAVESCGFRFNTDLSASRVQEYLAELREGEGGEDAGASIATMS